MLLILPTYFIAQKLFYPDQEYVDETQEPLTDFSRYSCPLYYLTPEAMEASKNFTAYRPVSGIIALDPMPVITGKKKGTNTENFYEWVNFEFKWKIKNWISSRVFANSRKKHWRRLMALNKMNSWQKYSMKHSSGIL